MATFEEFKSIETEEKEFEKFRYEYLQNVIKLLPESQRAKQLKFGGIPAQLVIEWETKFLKEPAIKLYRSGWDNGFDIVNRILEDIISDLSSDKEAREDLIQFVINIRDAISNENKTS